MAGLVAPWGGAAELVLLFGDYASGRGEALVQLQSTFAATNVLQAAAYGLVRCGDRTLTADFSLYSELQARDGSGLRASNLNTARHHDASAARAGGLQVARERSTAVPAAPAAMAVVSDEHAAAAGAQQPDSERAAGLASNPGPSSMTAVAVKATAAAAAVAAATDHDPSTFTPRPSATRSLRLPARGDSPDPCSGGGRGLIPTLGPVASLSMPQHGGNIDGGKRGAAFPPQASFEAASAGTEAAQVPPASPADRLAVGAPAAELALHQQSVPASRTLLIKIHSPSLPVTIETMHAALSPYGRVLRVVMFTRGSELQVLAELDAVASACAAEAGLHRTYLYPGANFMRVRFSHQQSLRVLRDTLCARDFERWPLPVPCSESAGIAAAVQHSERASYDGRASASLGITPTDAAEEQGATFPLAPATLRHVAPASPAVPSIPHVVGLPPSYSPFPAPWLDPLLVSAHAMAMLLAAGRNPAEVGAVSASAAAMGVFLPHHVQHVRHGLGHLSQPMLARGSEAAGDPGLCHPVAPPPPELAKPYMSSPGPQVFPSQPGPAYALPMVAPLLGVPVSTPEPVALAPAFTSPGAASTSRQAPLGPGDSGMASGVPAGGVWPFIPPQAGRVVCLSGLDPLRPNPDALHALLTLAGDVLRVKVLYRQREKALVEFSDPHAAATAIATLDGCPLPWGALLGVLPSSKPGAHAYRRSSSTALIPAQHVSMDAGATAHARDDGEAGRRGLGSVSAIVEATSGASHDAAALEDSAAAFLFCDYTQHPRRHLRSSHFAHIIYPPNNVLHVARLPAKYTREMVHALFAAYGLVMEVRMLTYAARKRRSPQAEAAGQAEVAFMGEQFAPSRGAAPITTDAPLGTAATTTVAAAAIAAAAGHAVSCMARVHMRTVAEATGALMSVHGMQLGGRNICVSFSRDPPHPVAHYR